MEKVDRRFYRFPFDRVRIYSETGSMLKPTYDSYYDTSGNLELKKTGEVNTYLDIQSWRESTDISCLLSHYKAGDLNALNRRQGVYSDISDYPDIHQLYNSIRSAENDFMSLPADVRAKFDNSFEQYLFSYGSKDFLAKLGFPDMVEPARGQPASSVSSEGGVEDDK